MLNGPYYYEAKRKHMGSAKQVKQVFQKPLFFSSKIILHNTVAASARLKYLN